jgi:hydroxymethylglutaryl-CoA reductase (NADPH)
LIIGLRHLLLDLGLVFVFDALSVHNFAIRFFWEIWVDKETYMTLRLVKDEAEEAPFSKKPLPQRLTYTKEARFKRLESLSEQQNCELSYFQDMRLEEKDLRGNIESLIGAIEIPVGVAGPLLIHGSHFKEEIFAPLATTEGALVSSVNRGCRALTMAQGVRAQTLKQRMVRAPLFDCGSLDECLALKNIIRNRWGEIQKRVRNYSNHAVLVELDCRIILPCLHVRFVYETGDASGQNMTTLCTWNICQWLLKEYQNERNKSVRQFIIDGNLSTDKKASQLSSILGRGREVVAEAFLEESIIRRVFSTTSQEMAHYYSQSQATGVLTGIHGLNVNVANVVAAMFAATGQDLACIHESSTSQVYFESRDGGLYLSLLMPSLVIGTVGGGVALKGPQQLLESMGAYGPGQANRLAEIIASFALALELSTGAALTSGHFAEAHERLGRNKKNFWFNKADCNTLFLNHLLASEVEVKGAIIESQEIEMKTTGSLVSELMSQVSSWPCGLWAFHVNYANQEQAEPVVLKVKAPDSELLLAQEVMASLRSPGLGQLLRDHRDDSPFRHSHVRELRIAQLSSPELRLLSPRVLGVLENSSRQIYVLAQEYLRDLELFGVVEKRNLWTPFYIEQAIKDISLVHGKFLNQTEELQKQPWMVVPSKERQQRIEEPFLELARQTHLNNMSWFTAEDVVFHEKSFSRLIRQWDDIESLPKTLIHNDFNTRNIGFRSGAQRSLVAYDWELATIYLPQRDVAELLCFCLSSGFNRFELFRYIELHRLSVEEVSGVALDAKEWLKGFEWALLDFMLCRCPMYSIAQIVRQVDFWQTTYLTAKKVHALLKQDFR